MKAISKSLYINGSKVDFGKLRKLLLRQYKKTYAAAQAQRAQYEKRTQLKYNAIPYVPFAVNDYVLLKRTDAVKNKITSNEEWGWYITEILKNGKKFRIKNIFNNDEEDVIAGHITRFHRPLWHNPRDYLDGIISRLEILSKSKKIK